MKKIVLSVEFHGDRMKTKAMKAVSKLSGVESVSVDISSKKLTITGDVDPVCVVEKLRKLCPTDVVSVGPVKEAKEKKEEPKKKEQEKKEEPKKDELNLSDFWIAQELYRQQIAHPYYYRSVVEEDPNSCVIC